MSRLQPVKAIVYRALEDFETQLGQGVNWVLACLVLLSSGIFVLETYPIPAITRSRLDEIDTGILIVFAVEYVLRFWVAEKKFKYLFSIFSLIDLISILPFLIGVLNISFLRVFRWFRILRLVRFIEGRTAFGYVSRSDSASFTRILMTLFIIIFVFSGLIYQVEHPIQRDRFSSFLDAVYFSVATLTTVGFGDIVPMSQLGRLLTILMILTGIILIPWQVGDLVKQLVKTSDQQQTICSGCGLATHDVDAKFCKNCGTALLD